MSTPSRARWAVSAQFFTNGVLGASFLPRFPEIKLAFDLSDTAYGFAVIAMPLGATLAAAVAGPLIRRYGAVRVASFGTVVFAWLLALAGFSPSVFVFVPIMLLAGVSDSILDTGQNVQGLAVERWNRKSIINSMHAAWSFGATTGGFIGAAAAATGVPIGLQMVAGAVVWSGVALGAAAMAHVPAEFERATSVAEESAAVAGAGVGDRAGVVEGSLLDDEAAGEGVGDAAGGGAGEPGSGNGAGSGDAVQSQGVFARFGGFPWRLFAPLAVLAIMGALVEDVANNWVTLYLNRDLGVQIGLAGAGFALALGAQFVGRLLGDPMTDRWGRYQVARFGGLMVAIGGFVAVLSTSPWLVIVGFALAGFGSATLIPAAFAASDNLPGVPHGTGVAMLGWSLRLGLLFTSPLIGSIADSAGLRMALLVLAGAGVVAAAIAHSRARSGV